MKIFACILFALVALTAANVTPIRFLCHNNVFYQEVQAPNPMGFPGGYNYNSPIGHPMNAVGHGSVVMNFNMTNSNDNKINAKPQDPQFENVPKSVLSAANAKPQWYGDNKYPAWHNSNPSNINTHDGKGMPHGTGAGRPVNIDIHLADAINNNIPLTH